MPLATARLTVLAAGLLAVALLAAPGAGYTLSPARPIVSPNGATIPQSLGAFPGPAALFGLAGLTYETSAIKARGLEAGKDGEHLDVLNFVKMPTGLNVWLGELKGMIDEVRILVASENETF